MGGSISARTRAGLLAAALASLACDRPSAVAPDVSIIDENEPVESEPAPTHLAWTGDPSILPERAGLPDDHALFAAVEDAATCDLGEAGLDPDGCEHWAAVEEALPVARSLGDGQVRFDVSLLRLLASPEPGVRQVALLALAGIGGLDYSAELDLASALLAAAESESDPATALLFAPTLAELDASELGLVDPLRILVTTHPVVELRSALIAAWSSELDDAGLRGLITELQASEDPALRRASLAATWQLAKDDETICPGWVEAADDPDPMVEYVALVHVIRFCSGDSFDRALKRLESRLKKGVVVEGINTILTQAKYNATTDKQRKRIAALLEDLAELGVEKWVGDD